MISFDEKLNNLNKKTMDLKQLYREETNLEPYQCIEIENNFTRHYVNWLESKINYTHSCESDSELLLCGVCDEETKHDTTLRNELHCLKCGNVAKE